MSAAPTELETPQPAPVPRLLVELPSWPRVFLGNLRDVIIPRRLGPLELHSAPAPFWPDVFVRRRLPWYGFVQSGACHVVALALLLEVSRFLALMPLPAPQPVFDHAQVIYYEPSEYLPPLDTRSPDAAQPRKADPEFSRQPIISVPPEADNRAQTIVTPPNIKLKRDIALPNIVAWSDKAQKPRLDIPPIPLTPAAELTRIAPKMNDAVAAPPMGADRLTTRRDQLTLSNVAAPPADIRSSRTAPAFDAPQPALVAPPPSVETSRSRTLGDLNIGASAVIAPAPQLPVAEQRAIPGGRSSALTGIAPQVVPPPPGSYSGSGAPGRVIALNLHPAIGAPPDPPQGNRRGSFAATPEGRAGASGSPGASSGNGTGSSGNGSANGSGVTRKGAGSLPSGLYVGSAPANAKTSTVAGDPAGTARTATTNPNVTASVRPPRVSSAAPTQPASAAKLTDPERAVFGDRKFYSLNVNMPNLNSAGGSWVIRFAEAKPEANTHNAGAAAADLSQPSPTRKVDPAYPTQLLRENVSGTVILYAVIHADGTVGNVRVLRGVDDRLDQYASQAVAQWKFDPATKNGSPVDVEATFLIPFKPSRIGTNF